MYHRIAQAVKPVTAELCSSNQTSLKCMSFLKILGIQMRTYKAEITVEWVKPPKVSCLDPSKSGDRGTLPQVDLSRPQFKIARTKLAAHFADREDISPETKEIASLKFAPHKEHIQIIKQDVLSKTRRHNLDNGSMEATIACLTIDIRNQQRHLKECRGDKFSRVRCKENIERRNSLLKHLRRMDYKRFEWLLEKLDIVYHPHPNPIVPVTRKGAIKKVTTFYCDKIRNEKLEAYKKELENEKVRFAEEKAVIEKWIDEEEKQLGLRN